MYVNPEVLTFYSVWIVNIIYCVGIVPQILLNYRLKSVRGLSDLMLMGYVVGYITYCYHIFLSDKNFPMAYKIMGPLSLLMVMVIVFQSFYYNEYKRRLWRMGGYVLTFALGILLLPFALLYPDWIAYLCGWTYFSIWLVYMLPQGVKIYMEKSVEGFSFIFVTVMSLGVFLELVSALFLGLSLPVILNALRGLAAYVIFCIFFYVYKK